MQANLDTKAMGWLEEKYPTLSVIVIRTPGAGGKYEYRVGIVRATDFAQGLRLDSDPLAFNREIAVRCFGKSRVYDRDAAVQHALKTIDGHRRLVCGVKILPFREAFPA